MGLLNISHPLLNTNQDKQDDPEKEFNKILNGEYYLYYYVGDDLYGGEELEANRPYMYWSHFIPDESNKELKFSSLDNKYILNTNLHRYKPKKTVQVFSPHPGGGASISKGTVYDYPRTILVTPDFYIYYIEADTGISKKWFNFSWLGEDAYDKEYYYFPIGKTIYSTEGSESWLRKTTPYFIFTPDVYKKFMELYKKWLEVSKNI